MINKLFSGIVALMVLFFASCTKDSSTPSLAGSRSALLAGSSGKTKTWKISSITEVYKATGYQDQTNTYSIGNGLPNCVADNIFSFSNNSSQDYSLTEGQTVCSSGVDTVNIEKGSWAFTNDGKNLLIDSSNNIPDAEGSLITTQGSDESYLYDMLFSLQRSPLTVTQLSATAMILTYSGSYFDTSIEETVNYTITLTFASGS